MLTSTKLQLSAIYVLNYQIGQFEKMREKYIAIICEQEQCTESVADTMMAEFAAEHIIKEDDND